MLGIFKKKKNITIKIESNLSNQKLENIERKMIQTHSEFEKITEIQKKYKSILEKYFYITEELWTKNTYKLVNSQESVFNKYADRYIELCNMYLQILPEYIEYDIEIGKVHNEKRIFSCRTANVSFHCRNYCCGTVSADRHRKRPSPKNCSLERFLSRIGLRAEFAQT